MNLTKLCQTHVQPGHNFQPLTSDFSRFYHDNLFATPYNSGWRDFYDHNYKMKAGEGHAMNTTRAPQHHRGQIRLGHRGKEESQRVDKSTYETHHFTVSEANTTCISAPFICYGGCSQMSPAKFLRFLIPYPRVRNLGQSIVLKSRNLPYCFRMWAPPSGDVICEWSHI